MLVLGVLVLAYFAAGLYGLFWFLENDSTNIFGFVLGIVSFFGLPLFLVDPQLVILPIIMPACFFWAFYHLMGLFFRIQEGRRLW